MAALEAGMPDQRKVIPEQDKLLPFLFWSLIVLRSKFTAVCQYVPVGIGSSVPNVVQEGFRDSKTLQYTAENSVHIIHVLGVLDSQTNVEGISFLQYRF